MPSRLDEQHRSAQLAVRAGAVRDALTLWSAVDLADIDGSWMAIAPGMEAVVNGYRRQSAGVAGGYYQAARVQAGVQGAAPLRLAGEIPPDALRLSLGYYATVIPKALVKAGRLDVMQQAGVKLAGAVARHVHNGGRETVEESVKADPQAQGWARFGSAEPCAFCLMLISRGPVYSEQTVRFEAHDHCACDARPVFDRREGWDDQALQARALWSQHAKGPDPINAFRRALERPGLHVA